MAVAIYVPRHGNDRLLAGAQGEPQRVRAGFVAAALAFGEAIDAALVA
jgi:hypothetical protein